VKGITGESFVPESLILPEGISALCDDVGLRTTILATLPTLDESGVAVRQTGGLDPHRGIRISDASAGCPQTVGVAPSTPARASRASIAAPRPLDKSKEAARSSSVPSGAGVSEEERRRRLRRADGSFVSPVGAEEAGSQKRQRTAGGAKETGSQAQGAQRRVSPLPPPPSGPPPPQPPPPSVQGPK
jgi:hypothetical protein